MSFKEKWLTAVEKKNSVLCAGLDPAAFDMGRREEGLPQGVDKRDWSLKYIGAVAPFCAAVKPNLQYWKNADDMKILAEINELAHSLDMVVIEDAKLADIGSTNDAGFFYSAKKKFDAVTYSPFAGNIEEAAKQAKERDIGVICMCLMSNPEYENEKNKLVSVKNGGYDKMDTLHIMHSGLESGFYVRQYIQLAHDSAKYKLDGVVIGAPSSKNHIKEDEIASVRGYLGDNMLVLLPGVGKQGGEAQIIWGYFPKNNVIVNVGRALMFPNGQNSSSKDHITAAKQYQDMLNSLRK